MTLDLDIVTQLPPELVKHIYEFEKPYIDYINKYDVLKWETLEDGIYEKTESSSSFIEDVDKIISKINPSIYAFNPGKWMYYDYIKMHPGKKYFWNDECTNYNKYNEKLLEFLQACDELIYTDEKYYSRLSSINELYELIIREL